MNDHLPYWVGFSHINGIGPIRLKALLHYFGDLRSAWQADPGELIAMGMDRRAVENLFRFRQATSLDHLVEELRQLGIRPLIWDDAEFPRLLLAIHDPPIVLYIKGELLPQDDFALAVVGTRKASVYGKEVTRRLTSELAASGLTIVSGLAFGIDALAHQTALEAGGRTIAVLGNSIDQIYPREHTRLADKILNQGAIVSEYPPGAKVDAGNFPRRNRIISGLSLGVIVMEAGRQSGALLTANYALEQDREVFAVPGNILGSGSAGTNELIQQGRAKLTMRVGDILEELNLTMVEEQSSARQILPPSQAESLLLQHLSAEPVHVDELGLNCGLPASDVSSTLTMMELKGLVRHVGGMQYVLCREDRVTYN